MSDDSDIERDIGQKDGEAHPFDTEFLDDTDDAHALMFGIWRGYNGLSKDPHFEESKMNPHYFYLGYLVGRFLQKLP